jgi:RNA polymerase sigma-70 factor (ECF subfamily)
VNIPTGDRHARFNEEMVPFMDALYNYAVYLSGNTETANDLLQETFLKAYRFYEKFERGTNAKAWLYRIMKNTYINEYRRIKRVPEIVEYDEKISPYQQGVIEQTGQDDLRKAIDGETFDDELLGAISALPEKFKSVVILRDVEEMPYEEIADILRIPVGTVRSRLHRARALLFSSLKSYASARGYRVRELVQPDVSPAFAG